MKITNFSFCQNNISENEKEVKIQLKNVNGNSPIGERIDFSTTGTGEGSGEIDLARPLPHTIYKH